MTRAICAGLAWCALISPAIAADPCATPAPAKPDPVLAADVSVPARQVYPGFCSIPPAPTKVRTAADFKVAVVKTRLSGAYVVNKTAPSTFHLEGDTTTFENKAKRQAAPPPPFPSPGDADTAAFINDARARATPPSPPR
jgi:hypothetical protein